MNSKYSDCIINYECSDNIGQLKTHRYVLAKCDYFDKLFQFDKPIQQLDITDGMYYYVYNIVIPFEEKLMLNAIDYLYDESTNILNMSLEYYGLMMFLAFDDVALGNYFKKIIAPISACICSGTIKKAYYAIKELCLSPYIEDKLKGNVLAAFMNRLKPIYQEKIIKKFSEYVPAKKLYYDTCVKIDAENMVHIYFNVGDDELEENEYGFKCYYEYSNDENTYLDLKTPKKYWTTKANILYRQFDYITGINEREKKITLKRDRYIPINDNIHYEIEIIFPLLPSN